MPVAEMNLKLGELALTGKGAKMVPLTAQGEVLKWTPGPLQILFQPKAFNDPSASRVSVCFRSTPEVEQYVQELEAWILNEVTQNPAIYLGQGVSADKIQDMFTSCIKTS